MTASTTMMVNTRFILVSCRRSFREHELDLRADLPVRSEVRSHDVVIRRYLSVYRQLANVKDLADAAAEWNGPLLTGLSLPVCRQDRCTREIEAALEVVIGEGLQQEVIVGAAGAAA